ncbi:hypothetical protein BDQ17DRAFT_1438367 [Cyathus striatus]|nr:hypothetical protein BDQ17DRAFT_1438367 [Cyathus striatus]
MFVTVCVHLSGVSSSLHWLFFALSPSLLETCIYHPHPGTGLSKSMADQKVVIGVIGGSGLYHLNNLTFVKHENPETPWGFPSSPIIIASLPSGTLVAF